MVGPILEALERKIGLRRDATRAPLRAPEWQRATSMPRPPRNTQISTRPRLTYCGPKLVLTKGSTLVILRSGERGVLFERLIHEAPRLLAQGSSIGGWWPSRVSLATFSFRLLGRWTPSRIKPRRQPRALLARRERSVSTLGT